MKQTVSDLDLAAAVHVLQGGISLRSAQPLIPYRSDPLAFVHDCFTWSRDEAPTAYQDEILSLIPVYRRVAVRGPHGLGKTALSAWVILWFALSWDGEDWKVPTTASAWRQLSVYLWPEVHKWARRLRWNKIGRGPFDPRTELMALSLRLRTGEAFALASDKAEYIEGAHADHILYLFDEAKAIPAPTFDAAEGALTGGDSYALMVSTPGEPVGRFYDVNARKPGLEDWKVRHIRKGEVIAAGRMEAGWAEQRARQWGEQSAVYQNRVEGEFASSEEDGIIPLAWVEAANERWHAAMYKGKVRDEEIAFTCVGVDVARQGEDQTVLALRFEDVITELRYTSREDTMATTGRVASILSAHKGRAIVDVIGIGAGVVDRLREQGYDVDAFNAGEGTDWRDQSGELGFINSRSAAWWNLRELLDPANDPKIALPPDDMLTGDLTAPKWRMTSGGRIQIESKDDMRKRLGRSTDSGDAVIQAFWNNKPQIPAWWLKG